MTLKKHSHKNSQALNKNYKCWLEEDKQGFHN